MKRKSHTEDIDLWNKVKSSVEPLNSKISGSKKKVKANWLLGRIMQ